METTIDLTTDSLERRLVSGEAAIARVRAAQMTIIREIDRRQTPLVDGCRSIVEWVTGRLDVAPETATTLVGAARRLEGLPTVEAATGEGSITFDRAVALAQIAEPSEDATVIDELCVYDVGAIRRLRSNRQRQTRGMEREAFDRRYMVAQPNLDESSWHIYGQLGAMAGRCFVEALDTKTDQLPPGGGGSRATRWADALWAISVDSLAGDDGVSIESATPLLTVFIDTRDAAGSNSKAGVVVEAGPRVGPDTIETILCNGVIEVTGRTEDGTPLGMGRRARTIPPRLRRYVLHRDGAVCTIEGCISRYRLQTHHITPWSDGGPTNADNLTTLCWFHHHIVIHGRGYTINPTTPPQRRRLNKPPIHAPPG